MSWVDFASAAAVCAALIVAPGAVLGAIIGLRGMWLMGLAVPFSVTVIAIAGVVAPFLGLGWSPLPAVVVFAVLAVVLGAVRWFTRERWPRTPVERAGAPRSWVWAVAVAIAAVLIGARMVQVIGAPGNISQTFDDIYHLNAVRYILESGTASPFEIGALTSPNLWFYPIGMHAVIALVVQLTGAAIPVALNATWIVFAALAWPLGVMLLARVFAGNRAAVAFGSATVAAALPAFPLLMADYGVLFPYLVGLSMTPAALAATVALFALGRDRIGVAPFWAAIAMLGALPALALTHPGAFMAWLAISAPVAVVAMVVFFRTASRNARIVAVLAFALYLVVGFVAVRVLRPPAEASGWPTIGTMGQAVGEVLTLSVYHASIPVVAAAFLLVGLIVVARRRTRVEITLLGMFVVVAVLYVVVAGVSNWTVRGLLTAPWYNNTPRLAALVPIVAVPIVALGVSATWDRLRATRLARKVASTRGGLWGALLSGLAVLLLVVSMQGRAMDVAVEHAQGAYRLDDGSPLVSADEMQLLTELPELVPEGVAVAGSPWTGAGLASAIAGRPVLMPHTLMDIDDDTALINDELDEATPGSPVCDAVREKNVGFVLDFGDREVHGGVHEFTGFDELADSDAVRLVREIGDARLYEVVGCS